MGTGPFILQSYAPRDSLVVTRNPNYWLKDANGVQLPYLDKVTFRVIESAETAEQALNSGDIDMFSDSAPAVIQDLRDQGDKVTLREQSKLGDTYYLLLDLIEAADGRRPRALRAVDGASTATSSTTSSAPA